MAEELLAAFTEGEIDLRRALAPFNIDSIEPTASPLAVNPGYMTIANEGESGGKMPKQNNPGVYISNTSGSIERNIIAGGDIVFGREHSSLDSKLRILIADVESALQDLAAQKEALREISAMAPDAAARAEESVRAAASRIPATGDLKPEDSRVVQNNLAEAAGLLRDILDSAEKVAGTTGAAALGATSLSGQLQPLLDKLAASVNRVSRLRR